MRWPFQRRPARRDTDPDVIAAAKRRAELDDLQLGVRERKLKIDAIERVVTSEADAITALEVVTVATWRGRHLPPSVYTRRKPEQSPFETMAMKMLEQKLSEDPTDALEHILERRERLEEAADRLSGRRGDEPETGNTLVDVARTLANSPLGEAIGNVLGVGMQQRVSGAAAVQVNPQTQRPVPPPVAELGAAATAPIAPTSPAPAASGPRPSSFRVGMALRILKTLSAADRARWILAQAEQNPDLGELVGPFLSAEPSAVPMILEAFITEATSGGDQSVLEWVPLVEYLRDNLEWTLETHAEMRALTIDDDPEDDADTLQGERHKTVG